ncbi:MAG: hypothetical protein HY275_05115 [Gemmatimonadetes bacterium]|nr:hypothetical protein [Gemmatimonadota bacterium]
MRSPALLSTASSLSLLLLTLHVTDDIVRGISKAEPAEYALVVLAILVYGTLALSDKLAGEIIMLLVGLFAFLMPVMHMRGTHYPEHAASPGGFFFVWTLWALGGIGGLTIMLAVRGIWQRRAARRSGAPPIID